jgi:endonuclease YncB( thermonuclease family)
MDIQLGFLLETIRVRDRLGRALLALNFFVAMVPDALAYDRAGQASIIDGDTLEIHGTRIRLCGIDAPESEISLSK